MEKIQPTFYLNQLLLTTHSFFVEVGPDRKSAKGLNQIRRKNFLRTETNNTNIIKKIRTETINIKQPPNAPKKSYYFFFGRSFTVAWFSLTNFN